LNSHYLKKIIAGLFGLMLFQCIQASSTNEKQLSVAMRMVGHQILLNAGDSTSRVLAIEKDSTHYTINFDAPFAFVPDDLIPVIHDVLKDAEISNGYIVEVIEKASQKVVYNYEMAPNGQVKDLPCLTRKQPIADYSILIYLLEKIEFVSQPNVKGGQFSSSIESTSKFNTLLLILAPIGLIGFFIMRRKRKPILETHLVRIGNSQVDKNNMALITENQRTDLSYKEAELLLLFGASPNTLLERSVILNKIWGDEGDYVGRTLDVYVSKLRKKIEMDTSLKIVNIRGLGYKLVINA